jgi:hypothetical protein
MSSSNFSYSSRSSGEMGLIVGSAGSIAPPKTSLRIVLGMPTSGIKLIKGSI